MDVPDAERDHSLIVVNPRYSIPSLEGLLAEDYLIGGKFPIRDIARKDDIDPHLKCHTPQ